MPIIPSMITTRISQAEFKELSFEVMRHVFDIHNEFGRLFDEKVYKRELAFRMESVATEVSVDLIHGTFFKQLFADLIVSQGGLFEFKMAESIHSRHRSQIIQYLLLFDLAHGKIVNMQTEQVQHEFVNCHQSLTDLRHFAVDADQLQSSVPGAGDFSDQLIAILRD
jgi:GxxExxY protein